MRRDQKVGLAFAILLIGIVTAMFFRNEPSEEDEIPVLQNPAEVDNQIAEKLWGPYLTGGVKTFDKVTGAVFDWWRRNVRRCKASDVKPAQMETENLIVWDNVVVPIPKHNEVWIADAKRQPNPKLKPSNAAAQQRRHRVKRGDTLSKLAKRYLGNPTQFIKIYEANRNVLKSPNDLQVGMSILIPDFRSMKQNGRQPVSTATSSVTTGTN